MSRRSLICALLLAALALSLGGNLWLFQRAERYYLELNRTRLDPLGLRAYPADALSPATGGAPLVVFFGDSRAAEWPLPALPGVRVVNRGIGAQTTAQVAGRFAAHVAPLQPTVVVVQVGINDLKTIPLFPAEQERIVTDCKAAIRQIVAEARQSGATVILTTIFPVGQLPLERRLVWSAAVDAAIAEVNGFIGGLAGEGVVVLPTAPLLADAQGRARAAYSRDFLHLNAAGYAALNQALAPLLAASLRQ